MSEENAVSEKKDMVVRDDLAFIKDVGQVFVQSGFFKDTHQAAQGMVKIMAGRELGFSPVASMTGIHIVEGKIELGANMMAALVRRSGRYDYRVVEHTPQKCKIEFYTIEDGKREKIGDSEFTMEDAQLAGLAGRANWKKHPRNMLFARAMSDGVKWHCPDVKGGAPMYHEGEISDVMAPSAGAEVKVQDPPKQRRTRRKPEPKPEPPPEQTKPETKHEETVDVLSGKDPEPVVDEEKELEKQVEAGSEPSPVEDTSHFPPEALHPHSRELLISQNGLTHAEWTALSEEQRKSDGHCTEAQLKFLKGQLSRGKVPVEQVLTYIQEKWPDVARSWQLSKTNLGDVLDWMQKA